MDGFAFKLMFGRRRDSLRRAAVLAATIVVGVQLAFAANAVAAPAATGGAWTPPNTPKATAQPVPRGHQRGESVEATSVPKMPQYQAPAFVPPAAGTRTVTLAAPDVAARTLDQHERQHRGRPAAVDGAPVWVGGNAAAPGVVQVDVAAPDRADAAGVASGLLLGVRRADASTAAAPVQVQVSPGAFAGRFGGNYAQRLRLVQLPSCALSTPQLVECQTRTPLATSVDPATGRLTTLVTVPAATGGAGASTMSAESARPVAGLVALAAESAPDGSAGSYAATSLKPSDGWSTSNTGAFSYSYPVTLPPTLGGKAPEVTLAYSSASVDGMTASTNAQSDWVGSGWSYNPGYIERSYLPCKDDDIASSGDTCWGWGGQEVSLDAAGMSGDLVYDDSSHKWHIGTDNGATVELKTGGGNGAYNGEYWVVTQQDGTRLYFGAGHLPAAEGGTGADPASSSAWTEPIYCPKAGDPCYNAGQGANSFTPNMAYRWNLDYVVDPHGNTTTYSYGTETNYYARGSARTLTPYTRAGYLKQINYGWRASDVAGQATPNPAAEVVFSTVQRCKGTAAECSTVDNLTKTTAPDWPDTPFDQICPSTGTCNNTGISYFSTVELAQIQTLVNKGGTYKPVDTYALAHSFPDANDGSSPSLWLDSVTHTGNNAPTAAALPPVVFTGTQTMANRVPGSGTWPAYNHQRIDKITTETGEQVTVTYANSTATIPACDQTPGASRLPSTTNNTMLCYQQYWQGKGQTDPVSDWFQKWVVSKVVQHDPVAGSVDKVTGYTYVGDAAWHRDDSVTTKNAQRSWNQFRGFGQVLTLEGAAPDPVTQKSATYLRGMNGDYNSQTGGTQKSVTVTDSVGDAVVDANEYSGTLLETDTYTQAGGTVTAKTIGLPWSAQTATHARTTPPGLPPSAAHFVANGVSKNLSLRADGTWRTTQTVNVHSPTSGLLLHSDDQGDVSLAGTAGTQEVCSTTAYATPPGSGRNTGMVNYETRRTTVAVSGAPIGTGNCPAPTAANTVLDRLTYYDGNTTTPGVIATVGNVTQTAEIDHYAGATPVYANTLTDGAFDDYGRLGLGTDGRGLVTRTDYAPPSGQLPTTVTTTDVTYGQATTTTVDQARQLPTKTVDPNGNAVSEAYDGLGRLTGVWLPGRATTQSASIVYAYTVNGTAGPSWSSTRSLRDDSTYAWAYTIYDGLGRVRQSQSVALDGHNGSLVADTFYDSHGWTTKKTDAYDVTAFPSSSLYPAADASVPGEQVTAYDGQGRPTGVTLYSLGQPQWTTTTAYPGADRTDVIPPAGGTPTSQFTDARGRVTALWHYTRATPDGDPAHASAIAYTYLPNGKQATVTGPGGQVWSYTYDLHGYVKTAKDPDSGTTTTSYSPAGDLLSSTDSRPQTVEWVYDKLGRKTSETGGGKPVAAWTYDTAPGGKGSLATSTAYVDGAAYVRTITGYTNRGAVTGASVTIPDALHGAPADENLLAGTYSTATAYKPITGATATTTYNADGGLPAETVTRQYNQNGVPTVVAGAADYLTSDIADPYGNLTTVTLGDMPNQVVQTTHYDRATGRVTEQFIDKQTGSTHVDDIVNFYNPAGRLTASRDVQDGGPTDLQCFAYTPLGQLGEAWTDSAGAHAAASPSVPNIGGCNTTVPSAATLGGPAKYWETYTYNAAGNRTSLVSHALDGNAAHDNVRTSTYTGSTGDSGQPDAVQSTINAGPGGAGTDHYVYDNTGNTVTRTMAGGPNQTITYNPQNLTASVTDSAAGKSATYRYDADGNLLLQRDTTGGAAKVTLYLGDEELTLDVGAAAVSGVRYYQIPGGPTVVRSSAGSLVYKFGNGQGTHTLTIAAGAGQAEARRGFTPFGAPRGAAAPSWVDGRAFVGRPQDPATGLDLLGARAYDPGAGHFLQRDPVLETADVSQIGGYTYAADDPVNGSDPTGLRFDYQYYGPGSDKTPGETPPPAGVLGDPNPGHSHDRPLTTKDGQTYWINDRAQSADEAEAMRFLNKDLRDTGHGYNAETRSGTQYIPVVRNNDNRKPDLLRVTWMDGEIVDVETVDIYEPKVTTDARGRASYIMGKAGDLIGKDKQADHVVVWSREGEEDAHAKAQATIDELKRQGSSIKSVRFLNMKNDEWLDATVDFTDPEAELSIQTYKPAGVAPPVGNDEVKLSGAWGEIDPKTARVPRAGMDFECEGWIIP
ncbi:RHS repeat-associated core domain-containing protein [Dactylosporangium sp. McL0621]|uniref:RHS repeat domain-containing protein n=1 Tax=Dactylosporangium sp. McL0621 TaxID=3415678 RepID=UPI003CED8F81